jgi:PAS domain S-box-containing protein
MPMRSGQREEQQFTGDATAVATKAVLPDRRELALVALERTRMPMVVTDARIPDNPIVLANHAFLELTGYSADEVVGQNCRFLQGPGTEESAVDILRRGLSAGVEVSVEMLNYRRDGTSFWNQLAISPVHDENGQLLYHFGSQKDVTEQRRARELEATERLLLMEVDHRAMNALALVQSIVRLTSSADAALYSAAVQGRVDALARAHRLLAGNGWAGATLQDLMKGTPSPRNAERLHLRGPDVSLPPKLVQPLAIVLHELMQNAATHGALAEPSGTLNVSWSHQAQRLLIDWQETGARDIAVPQRRGFGLTMIEGVIKRQLDGSAGFNWLDRGMRACLEVPLNA